MGEVDPGPLQFQKPLLGQLGAGAEVAVAPHPVADGVGVEPPRLLKVLGPVPQVDEMIRPRVILKYLTHPGKIPVAVRHHDDPHPAASFRNQSKLF